MINKTEKAHGIMFHHFHDEGAHIKGQGSIDQDQFRKMIVWLKEKYNLLSAKDWYNKALQGNLDRLDTCITFDDNLQCQYDIALPVLEEFDLGAFWFVYSSPLEGVHERLEIYRYFRFSEFQTIQEFYDAFHATLKTSSYQKEVEEGIKDYDFNEFLKGFSFYTEEDKIFRFIRDMILGTAKY